MSHCTKRLVYSATNLKNPADAGVLFGESQAQVVSADYPGIMTLSIGVVRIPSESKHRVENIFCGVAENYSYVRKSYNPINTIRFFGAVENKLSLLLESIDEAMIASTAMEFNGIPVGTLLAARSIELRPDNTDRAPSNKLEFHSDPASLTFPFAPRFVTSGGSIFNRLTYLDGVSFIDTAAPGLSIDIPVAYRYIILILNSVAPTPISSFRATASNITVAANVSFDIIPEALS